MKTSRALTLTLVTAVLAACGGETPPATPKDEAPPAVEAPAEAATPAPSAPMSAPPQAPPPVKEITAIPADAIGGTPVANVQDAFTRGNAALDKYLTDRQIPRESFYVKETARSGDRWDMMVYGSPNNVGQYLHILVYDDGRAEVVAEH